MAKSKSGSMGLAMQMLIGLVLGVIVGMFLDSQFATTYVKPFGDLFIRLIRMVVVPLVFATLVAGAAGISDVSKLGRVAIKTLLIFLITSAISVIFGLVIANIIDPGIGLTLSTEGLKAAQVKSPRALFKPYLTSFRLTRWKLSLRAPSFRSSSLPSCSASA